MKKIIVFFKILSFLLVFSFLFLIIQMIITPKYINRSTTIVDGFYNLENESLDVLFLGSSSMFSSTDAQFLTEEFSISSYCFGASGQYCSGQLLYLNEALKTQTPKLVVVEISSIFRDNITEHGDVMAWTYAPLPLSVDKVVSLYEVSNGNLRTVLSYSLPLLQFHSRWKDVSISDISYYFDSTDYSSRGYIRFDKVEEQVLLFESNTDIVNAIPNENIENIKKIIRKCEEKGIKVIFYKAPSADWSKNDSIVVKNFMESNNYEFIDLHEYLDFIGINRKEDFNDPKHVNKSGARKVTLFLGNYLREKI